jgi:hypothetical protein
MLHRELVEDVEIVPYRDDTGRRYAESLKGLEIVPVSEWNVTDVPI